MFNFIQPEIKANTRDLKNIRGLWGSLPIYSERHYHIEFAKEKDTLVFQSNTIQQLVIDAFDFCEGILNSLGIMRSIRSCSFLKERFFKIMRIYVYICSCVEVYGCE